MQIFRFPTGFRLAAAPLVPLVLVSVLLAGCARETLTLPPGTFDPDKVLFERGTKALDERRWFTAREYFRQIWDGYPQSPYRADAKLGLGDTYLGERSAQAFVLGINEFREFLAFFPTHPRADYAQYKLAMAYYYQMARPERDQTNTKEALREFDVFFERFPNSELMPEVRKHHREARDRLSQSEYRVGLFYFRSRWYPGAIDRFRAVLRDDPEFTHRDAVYFHLAESLVRMKQEAEALPYFERLVQEFEVSEFLAQAHKRIAELKAGMPMTARKPGETQPF
jgi:outer membrane protein assembly factor BamD